MIFGRTGIIILLILLQFGFLIAGYTYLQGKMYFIDSVVKAGAVILVIYLTNNRSNPAFKMVWMTIMLVAPVFGVLLYILWSFRSECGGSMQDWSTCTKRRRNTGHRMKLCRSSSKKKILRSHRWHIMSVNTADFRHMKTPASNTSAVGKIRLKN